jgi:hypothetical protein
MEGAMARANSDNNNTKRALDRFFSVFNPHAGAGTYKNLNILMDEVFCADIPFPLPPSVPAVGITKHGPQFRGSANVRGLFQQLIDAFPDVSWAESATHPDITPVPRLYSNDDYATPTVGVQTTLFGTHKGPWFQDPARYSLPLSAIKPKNKTTEVPSFAVFTFGAQNGTRVSQLSFYMDRYNQMRETQAYADANDFDTDMRKVLKDIHNFVGAQELAEKTQAEFSKLIKVLEKRK